MHSIQWAVFLAILVRILSFWAGYLSRPPHSGPGGGKPGRGVTAGAGGAWRRRPWGTTNNRQEKEAGLLVYGLHFP